MNLNEMLENYKKLVQVPFEKYQEETKEETKENLQYMVYKMANDDVKIFENLNLKEELIKLQEEHINNLENVINKAIEKLDSGYNVVDYDDTDFPRLIVDDAINILQGEDKDE